LLVFLTQGVGMFFGYRIMAGGNLFGVIPLNLTFGRYGEQVNTTQYVENLAEARGEAEAVSFLETFTKMFSRALPDGMDAEVLSSTMQQWKTFWVSPAIMAGIILVVFAVAFWDRSRSGDDTMDDAPAAT
ncbi:MAG: MFS transporter, partial [Planctomycetota bacterium]